MTAVGRNTGMWLQLRLRRGEGAKSKLQNSTIKPQGNFKVPSFKAARAHMPKVSAINEAFELETLSDCES